MTATNVEHVPTAQTRELVEMLVAIGTPQDSIAAVLKISDVTLRKHYAFEIETAGPRANAKVGSSLFNKAIGNGPQSVTAAIFWLKCRARWKEVPIEIAHSGKVAVAVEASQLELLPDDELRALVSAAHRLSEGLPAVQERLAAVQEAAAN